MKYTVKKLAKLAGISVRTLHYYDELGLLRPSSVGANGYRYYELKELMKLQQILFFRELEFSLDQIKIMISNPRFDALAALRDQKKLLEMNKTRIEGLLKTIDTTIMSVKGGVQMSDDQLYGSLTKKQMDEYKEEAQKRWGNTDAYKQSMDRTKNWTKADYDRIAKEGAKWTKKMAEVMKSGAAVDSTEVQELIDRHYKSLRTFYEPNYEMYKGLGQLYVDDPRFMAFYEKYGAGLAQFMCDAMAYYSDQHVK